MNKMGFFRLAASTVILGAGVSLGAGVVGTVQAAVDSSGKLAGMARKVETLLAKHDTAKAVSYAEQLVTARPNDASFRMLLGQAYLSAGRFGAAGTSFEDVLKLSPGNEKAALNLALTQIALGKTDNALSTLEQYRDGLNSTDYGLALALAGRAEDGVQVLEAAARGPGANARTRQNLALAYALTNRWIESRAVMQQDLSPDLVDQRIVQWASFVRPSAAWDQVASLLNVTPVYDPGQPTALALNIAGNDRQFAAAAAPAVPAGVAPPASFEAAATPPAAFEVGNAAPAPVTMAAAEAPAPSISSVTSDPVSHIVFGPRMEVVQALPVRVAQAVPAKAAPRAKPVVRTAAAKAPVQTASADRFVTEAPLIKAAKSPAKQQIVATGTSNSPKAPSGIEAGKFVVQLGAFSSANAARSAWERTSGKFNLANYDPAQSRVKVKAASLYRLSVTGFTSREDAGRICSKIQADGGTCFVRSVSGEATPQWAKRDGKKPAQVAIR